jgi:methylmalonyl-CoA mutase N-terminal domain/subunit
MAFTLASAIGNAKSVIKRGLQFDDYGCRLVFSNSTDVDFFETIAKIRAGRRIWSKIAKEQFKSKEPHACKFRIALRTSCPSLTRQEPINNIARITIGAMAAVFAGAQSIDLAGYDEAFGIPSEEAQRVNLGIHNIIAYESANALTADPLGGSYYLEWLTNEMEDRITNLLDEIDEMGGIYEAIEKRWFRKQFEEAVITRQKEIDEQRKILIGVNKFPVQRDKEIPLKLGKQYDVRREREATLKKYEKFKRLRNIEKVKKALLDLYNEAKRERNLIRPAVEAFKADATVGEVVGVAMEGLGSNYDSHFRLAKRPSFLEYRGGDK